MSQPTANVSETDEEMPFVYRITNRGAGDVGVDVGDEFEKSESWPNTMEGYMAQIGLDMVRKGLQFMGLDSQPSELLCILAIKQAEEAA